VRRSTLVCNMLSYVEFYQPSYFQLENVTGLLQFPLNGRQVERTIVDGIKMGVVKFIERSLIALGYVLDDSPYSTSLTRFFSLDTRSAPKYYRLANTVHLRDEGVLYFGAQGVGRCFPSFQYPHILSKDRFSISSQPGVPSHL
jgi:hypothetical protein